ncbi:MULTISPECIES: hypothetical protein [unclassified Thiocapsa]
MAHERAVRYREFVRGAIPQGERTLIREALGNSPEDSGSRIT